MELEGQAIRSMVLSVQTHLARPIGLSTNRYAVTLCGTYRAYSHPWIQLALLQVLECLQGGDIRAMKRRTTRSWDQILHRYCHHHLVGILVLTVEDN